MSPSYQHSYVCLSLGAALKQQGGYSVFVELTIQIDGRDYIPDLSLYPQRKVVFGAGDILRMTEIPLSVVEILSPSQSFQDAFEKFAIYFQAGVKSCWLVQPAAATVTVYTAIDTFQLFHSGEVIDPVTNLHIPIDVIFE